MKHLPLFLLALVLFVAIALSHVSRGVTAPVDPVNMELDRKLDSTKVELIDTNAESNGFSMEISALPSEEFILTIPKNNLEANTLLDFKVYLTNHRSTLIPVNILDIPSPEILRSDGQVIKPQGGKNPESVPEKYGYGEYNCAFLNSDPPGVKNYLGFIIKTKLSRYNNKLRLEFFDRFGNLWFFDALEPKTYQLRFSYDIPSGTASCYDPNTKELKTLEGIQPGRGFTQFISLRFVEILQTERSAVEVDGIQFKVEMPETILVIPANQPSGVTPVKVGMRITNNRSTPLYFMNSIDLTLIGQDTQPVERNRGDIRLGYIGPYLVRPKESVLFLANGRLSCDEGNILLEMFDDSSHFWSFRDLNPGVYQLRFIYQGTNMSRQDELIAQLPTDLWRGWIALPPVEIRLVQH